MALLADADRLVALAELVGVDALPDSQRMVMLAGRLLREGVLQQSSLSVNDGFCSATKGGALADAVLEVVDRCQALVESGVAAAPSRRSTSPRCCGRARRSALMTPTASTQHRDTMLARLEALA